MEIYIIYSNESGYESHNHVIGYKSTESEAKKAVETLIESYNKAKSFYDEVIIPAEKNFKKENPYPKYLEIISWPRWPSRIKQSDITQEMKDERELVKKSNNLIAEKNQDAYNTYHSEKMTSVKPLFESMIREPWFEKWFDFDEGYISCKADGLVEGFEYIYEKCEELK